MGSLPHWCGITGRRTLVERFGAGQSLTGGHSGTKMHYRGPSNHRGNPEGLAARKAQGLTPEKAKRKQGFYGPLPQGCMGSPSVLRLMVLGDVFISCLFSDS